MAQKSRLRRLREFIPLEKSRIPFEELFSPFDVAAIPFEEWCIIQYDASAQRNQFHRDYTIAPVKRIDSLSREETKESWRNNDHGKHVHRPYARLRAVSLFSSVSHVRERASSGEAARREKRGRQPEKKEERLPAQLEPMKFALASQRKLNAIAVILVDLWGPPYGVGFPGILWAAPQMSGRGN